MPVLESESDYFRVTLPNLLYGFTDEQLVAAVDNTDNMARIEREIEKRKEADYE